MKQRFIIGMMDGLGVDYLQKTAMTHLKNMIPQGFYKTVKGIFPSVTNVNNVSINTGEFPEVHGICANFYYDRQSGDSNYMNSSGMIRCDTLFQRAKKAGIKSALLTSKKKTAELFHKDTEICIAAEDCPADWIEKYGNPGPIYSREINYWLWKRAYDLLKERPDIGLIYVHITDYPMHAWPPEAPESQEHLMVIDRIIGQCAQDFPDTAFFFTADHGMNFKKQCWDLDRHLRRMGIQPEFVLSPEKDYYIKHHRNFTGCSWIWLKSPEDMKRSKEILLDLKGVESVMEGNKASKIYHLPEQYMGDLVVFGDRHTMFGDMDNEYEQLPPDYRAHGSLHEMELPLIIFRYDGFIPEDDSFEHNKDLTSFLFR